MTDTDILRVMPIIITHLLNREILGIAYLTMSTMSFMQRHMVQLGSIGDCTFGIVHNANYAETHGTIGKY